MGETPGWGDSVKNVVTEKSENVCHYKILARWVSFTTYNARVSQPLTVRSILFIAQKEQILQKKINVLKLLGFELFIKINT